MIDEDRLVDFDCPNCGSEDGEICGVLGEGQCGGLACAARLDTRSRLQAEYGEIRRSQFVGAT